MYKYKNVDIREIVNDNEWQSLRESFLGTWKSSLKENVEKLRKYLEIGEEYRYVRVYNYLTGTAFRLGVIRGIEVDQLKEEVKRRLK